MVLPSNLSYLHPTFFLSPLLHATPRSLYSSLVCHATYTLRLFHEVIAEFAVCLKVSSQNWEKYSMHEFSDSMYVVFCFNSWYLMKIVTIPIPYSKYRGTIIICHCNGSFLGWKGCCRRVNFPSEGWRWCWAWSGEGRVACCVCVHS